MLNALVGLVQQAEVAELLLYFCSRLQQHPRPSGRTACAKPNQAGSVSPPVSAYKQRPVAAVQSKVGMILRLAAIQGVLDRV